MHITSSTPKFNSDFQNKSVQKVAHDFESLFASMMLKSMRKTLDNNPLIPQSFGEKIYTEMLDDEYSNVLSKSSSLGLAELIVKELEKQGNQTLPVNPSLDKLWMLDNAFIPSQSQSKGSNGKVNESALVKVKNWKQLINEASELFGVDSNLISAMITQESGGNPFAVSKAGAKGLMQLMDTTAAELGVADSFSPKANIFGGVKYLRTLLDRFEGNEQLALASYNAGPAAVEKYNGIPPYNETQNYVKSVTRLKQLFSNNQGK